MASKFLTKDGFSMVEQIFNFLDVKVIWLSHNVCILLARFWLMFSLYLTGDIGLSSFICFEMLFVFGGYAVTLFVTILTNVSLTKIEDHLVGYWFVVQISWFFLTTLKDCRSLVALKNSVFGLLNHTFAYVVTVHSYRNLGLCQYQWVFVTNDS